MRVAICMSGQLRTWKNCSPNVFELVSRLGHQVDFFCHAWDFDSIPRPVIVVTGQEETILHSQETINSMLETYKPVKYLIEDQEKNKSVIEETTNKGLEIQNKRPPAFWTCPQFYGIMAASNLKKEYELEHNFKYDVCIRLRYDQYIPESEIKNIIEVVNKVEPNTIYTMHNREHDGYPKMLYGDVFWICDSSTYDKVAMFYKAIPIIDADLFVDCTPPENVLTHYINCSGIKNYRTYINLIVCRFKSYIDKKIQLGLGNDGSYEVIYENIDN